MYYDPRISSCLTDSVYYTKNTLHKNLKLLIILDAKYYLSAKSFWKNSGKYLTKHTDEVLQLSAVKKIGNA